MCSYDTTKVDLVGSGKAAGAWHTVGSASVYSACPFHSALEEALNIDFIIQGESRQRIALELSVDAAAALANAILATLARDRHI